MPLTVEEEQELQQLKTDTGWSGLTPDEEAELVQLKSEVGGYRKQWVGTQAKGWMRLANSLMKIPIRVLGEPMSPEKVAEIDAYVKETYGPDNKFEPTSVTPKYMQTVKEHTEGMKSIIKSHPEWEYEAPRGFVDLVTSPRKLSLVVSEAAPLMAAAGVTTAAGAPTVAFGMMYAAEGQEAYDQAIADGATDEQANTAYHVYGSVAAVIENLQLKGIMKGFSKAKRAITVNKTALKVAGKSITKDAVKLAAQEAVEEMAQQGWQEATAKIVYDKSPSGGWKGVVDRQLSAGLVGGVMGLIPGLSGATTGMAQQTFQEQTAEAKAEDQPLTPERWQEIKDETGPPPTDREIAQFAGQAQPEALFESEKIKAQQAAEEAGTRKLVEQEQGKRAFTPEEAVTPEQPKLKPVQAARPEEQPKAGTIADRKARQAAIEAKTKAKAPITPKKPAKPLEAKLITKTGLKADVTPKVTDVTPKVTKPYRPDLATKAQKATAHILQKEMKMSDADFKALAGKSMTEMTRLEASDFIDKLKPPKKPAPPKRVVEFTAPEKAEIKKSAKSSEVFAEVLGYAESLGKAPKDPQIRKSYIKDLREVALVKKRIKKKFTDKGVRKDQVNLFNQFSSARYAFGQAEVKSGVPLRKEYSNIVANANKARLESDDIIRGVLKKAGITPWSSVISRDQNSNMADWLFESNPQKKAAFRAKMTPKVKKIADGMQGILQHRAANEVREARWRLWDTADRQAETKIAELEKQIESLKTQKSTPKTKRDIKDVKDDITGLKRGVRKLIPPNASAEIMEKGRDKDLKKWIATQTWGTRQAYFMSEQALDDLIDMASDVSIATTIEEKGVTTTKGSMFLREAQTRTGEARVKGGSVINATTTHLERLMTFNATYDQIQGLWGSLKGEKITKRDMGVLKGFIDTAVGKREQADAYTRIGQKFTRIFWRTHFINPVKSAWFVTRNLLQNIAYAPSQMSIAEWTKSIPLTYGKKAARKPNPEMAKAFEKEWKIKISQKRQMYRQFMLQDEGDISKKWLHRSAIIMDYVGGAATMSDEINRISVWPVLYSSAQRNAKLYKKGKVSFGTLSNRLRLDTLHVTQRMELKQLLETNPEEFQARYAEYKTENIHFKYETAFRAGSEQKSLSRIAGGLTVYPRGFMELAYQNSAKPLIQGMKTGNSRMFYQGLISLIMLGIGAEAARELVEKITGKTAYGLFGSLFQYSPVGPGLGKSQEFFNKINNMKYAIEDAEGSGEKTKAIAEEIGKLGADLGEMMIPIATAYINHYENANNVYGVRLWSLVKKEYKDKYGDEYGRNFRETDRTFVEKLQHQIFGGAERGKDE